MGFAYGLLTLPRDLGVLEGTIDFSYTGTYRQNNGRAADSHPENDRPTISNYSTAAMRRTASRS